ncbi:MAG TPA: cohesin domain-containing protein [Anaerolineae bacterium]|nr:cohesin domain-containing protein [Anaerolineae bacterium]
MNETGARHRWIRGLGQAALAVLLLTLAGSSLSGRSVAQQPPVRVRVLGPTAPVPAGQTFTVTVAIENVQNLGAFEFEYNFTPAVASAAVDNIQLGGMLGTTGRTTGTLRLASAPGRPGVPLFGAYSYGTADGPNGSGVLATVAMSAVSPGTSQIDLSGLKVTNVAGNELLSSATAGSVTVVAGRSYIYLPLLLRGN